MVCVPLFINKCCLFKKTPKCIRCTTFIRRRFVTRDVRFENKVWRGNMCGLDLDLDIKQKWNTNHNKIIKNNKYKNQKNFPLSFMPKRFLMFFVVVVAVHMLNLFSNSISLFLLYFLLSIIMCVYWVLSVPPKPPQITWCLAC